MQSDLELGRREEQRIKKVRYYVGDPEKNRPGHLYEFCVQELGYDALSPTFHAPMMAEMDRMDLMRFRIFEGVEEFTDQRLDDLNMWARGHIKTWIEMARVLRYYLWNPGCTVTWWHAVEAKAYEAGQAIADHLQFNRNLRALFPQGILPAENAKKFFAGGVMKLRGSQRRIGDAPSLVCMGAGGEGTGGHSLVAVLDDIVGLNDVIDSQMPKKKFWIENTVSHVVLRKKKFTKGTDAKGIDTQGWKDCCATHWSIDDPYVEFRKSPSWRVTVRGAKEVEGVPNRAGSLVYLSEAQYKKAEDDCKSEASILMQLYCDPSPSSAKPWKPECEQMVSMRDWAKNGRGLKLVVTDPAPATLGGGDPRGEKRRGDAEKNYWAYVVGEIRARKQVVELCVLEAAQDRDWTSKEGWLKVADAAARWGAPWVFYEAVGLTIASYPDEIKEARTKRGAQFQYERLKATHLGKNVQFESFSAKAKLGQVYILETVDPTVLQDLLYQCRNWRPLPGGLNGLKFDDLANCATFLVDPAVVERAPQPMPVVDPIEEEMEREMELTQHRTRYMGM